jgi:hypothetical protein
MFRQVIQVIPTRDFKVYVYFSDGKIKIYDVKPLIGSGVFKHLADEHFFMTACTVMNNTLAWDVSGRFDKSTCIDIDPDVLYEKSVEVKDPLEHSA